MNSKSPYNNVFIKLHMYKMAHFGDHTTSPLSTLDHPLMMLLSVLNSGVMMSFIRDKCDR